MIKKFLWVTLFLLPLSVVIAKSYYEIRVAVFPQNAKILLIDTQNRTNQLSFKTPLPVPPDSEYKLVLSAKGYYPKTIQVKAAKKSTYISEKLEKKWGGMTLVKTLPVSGNPKSIMFLDDDRFIANAMTGCGFDLYSLSLMKRIKIFNDFSKQYCPISGFVEGLVDKEQNEFYIMQLYAYKWHVFDLTTMKYKKSITAKGNWSKVVAKSDKYLFFSNWLSKDIAVYDRFTKKFVLFIKVAGVPRGLAITPDQKYLYTAIFDGSFIQKIDLATMKVVKTITLAAGKGNARHLIIDEVHNLMYISDMGKDLIFKYDLATDKVISSVKVYTKPNNIVLSPDLSTIFVACRGPNGPNGYTNKGIEFGKVWSIDAKTMTAYNWVWGGNQPTGLDISPDGQYLLLGNFLDNNIEVYKINYALLKSKEEE
ncbi:MAG: YncE family protein [Brevinematales bacterium]|nr:YncE family protein [Brevinematales bacterium]